MKRQRANARTRPCLRCGRLFVSADPKRRRLCKQCLIENAKLGPLAEPVHTEDRTCDDEDWPEHLLGGSGCR